MVVRCDGWKCPECGLSWENTDTCPCGYKRPQDAPLHGAPPTRGGGVSLPMDEILNDVSERVEEKLLELKPEILGQANTEELRKELAFKISTFARDALAEVITERTLLPLLPKT